MLPQKARLRKTRDFKEVFDKGRGAKEGRLFLKAAKIRERGVRFGIVVSKQVAAKAVDRNRIKRFLREALQEVILHVKPGYDIVLVTLPGFGMKDLQDAKQKVSRIIKQSFLFKS